MSNDSSLCDPSADTVIYPLVQMGPFGVRIDEYVTDRLFKSSLPDVTVYLASGYLNLVDKYKHSIVHQCAATFRILTAAPEVIQSFTKFAVDELERLKMNRSFWLLVIM
jgi:hypothetical protein